MRALIDSRNKLKKSYSSSAMEIINSRGWKNLKEVAQDLNIEIRDIRIPEERVLEQMGEGALDPDEIEEIRKRNISVK